METVHAYAVRHKDGAYVNIRWEPVKGIKNAYRSQDREGLLTVLYGVHKPDNPNDFYLQPITIKYEEDTPDE